MFSIGWISLESYSGHPAVGQDFAKLLEAFSDAFLRRMTPVALTFSSGFLITTITGLWGSDRFTAIHCIARLRQVSFVELKAFEGASRSCLTAYFCANGILPTNTWLSARIAKASAGLLVTMVSYKLL
jgi:hypothetical protein